MKSQLGLEDLWSQDGPGHREPVTAPPARDPRDADLLSGPQVLRSRLVDACGALDAAAVRQLHHELQHRFLGQDWSARAEDWAATIEWLSAAVSLDESVERVLALAADAPRRLPGAPADVTTSLVGGALRRAAERLLAERGPAAELPDGRAAAELHGLAGDWTTASAGLVGACEASPRPPWWMALGEAATRLGDTATATRAWCRACLLGPGDVLVERIECEPVQELLDQAEELELPEPRTAWVPVLAELKGLLALKEAWIPAGDGPALEVARLACRYRATKPRLAPPERLHLKRELLRLAPQLKPLVRGL
jgi:hypothetical protein